VTRSGDAGAVVAPPPPVAPARPAAPEAPRARARGGRIVAFPAHSAPALLAGMAAITALAPVREHWPAQLALLALVLTVPGLCLTRALRVPPRAISTTPVYVPAASIVVLLAAGLAVDLAGPTMGVARPLDTLPVLVALEGACLVLLSVGPWRRRGHAAPVVARTALRVRDLWPLLLPLASAAGAARLSNGEGGALATGAVVAAIVAAVLAVVAGGRLRTPQLAMIVFGVGLALAWSFSLRGGGVYGFDIAGELPTAGATSHAGVWHLAHPGDAYGAMLSLTVLPSALHSITGIGVLVLLKAVYPAILALFPVTVVLIARRFLSARWSVVAGVVIVSQANFAKQLPAVARQEIGLLLFAVLLAVVLDRRMSRGSRWSLTAVLAAGLVVSHYSTTYLAIAILAIGALLQLAVSFARPVQRVTGAVMVGVVVLSAGAGVWYGALTHSAGNVTRVAGDLRADGLRLLPDRQAGDNPLQAYLSGNSTSNIDAEGYGERVHRDYAENRPYIVPLPDAGAPRYALTGASAEPGPVRAPLLNRLLDRAQLGILQLLNLLTIVGALWLALRRRTRPLLRTAALLGAGALVALAVIRLSGTVSKSYNQDRALIQALVPLSLGLAWLGWRAEHRLGRARMMPALLAAAALAVVMVTTSGLAGLIVDRPSTNLANRGEDFERYYVTPTELASANWLRGASRGGGLIYTDRYGQLRTIAEGVRSDNLYLDVTPRTLDQHAWIYGSSVNVVDGRARGSIGTAFATYRWPERFIADHWATVYANGGSEVFHR
jgi:hypothetical protein